MAWNDLAICKFSMTVILAIEKQLPERSGQVPSTWEWIDLEGRGNEWFSMSWWGSDCNRRSQLEWQRGVWMKQTWVRRNGMGVESHRIPDFINRFHPFSLRRLSWNASWSMDNFFRVSKISTETSRWDPSSSVVAIFCRLSANFGAISWSLSKGERRDRTCDQKILRPCSRNSIAFSIFPGRIAYIDASRAKPSLPVFNASCRDRIKAKSSHLG